MLIGLRTRIDDVRVVRGPTIIALTVVRESPSLHESESLRELVAIVLIVAPFVDHEPKPVESRSLAAPVGVICVVPPAVQKYSDAEICESLRESEVVVTVVTENVP